jgi:hypothetical protein
VDVAKLIDVGADNARGCRFFRNEFDLRGRAVRIDNIQRKE